MPTQAEEPKKKVAFKKKVETFKIPHLGGVRKASHERRTFQKHWSKTNQVPKPKPEDTRCAIEAANQLHEVVARFDLPHVPSCKYECSEKNASLTCDHCERFIIPNGNPHQSFVPSIATPAPKGRVSWLVDSGSEQDLVSENMLATVKAADRRASDVPISLLTANGQTQATEVANVTIPSLMEPCTPYILEQSPAVLSVGLKCMEQGYDFLWFANQKPLLVRPDGKVIELRIDGHVPMLDDSCIAYSKRHYKRLKKVRMQYAMPGSRALSRITNQNLQWRGKEWTRVNQMGKKVLSLEAAKLKT